MKNFNKRGAIKDVDPNDIIKLLQTIGKILSDIRKKDSHAGSSSKK